MNVLLTHAYFLDEDPKERQIMRPYPPLGILYLAAYLEERGVSVTVFDTTFSTRATLENRLLNMRPDVVGIYTNLMTKLNVLRLIRFIRSQPALSATRIVLGGPEVTHHAEKFLEHGADVIVVGEGEETTHALVSVWSQGSSVADADLTSIAGIVFRDREGRVVRNGARPLMRTLDDLPMPKRDALDLRPYLDAWKARHGKNAISVSTMRGCPYSCRWCSRAVYGESYRRRSPRRVVDEIEAIVARYQPDSLWFVDDVFTINHRWLEELTVELERRDLRVPYECITRADRLDERSVGLLRRSGCFRVWIGAESGSQKVLDAMDRRVKVDRVREMIQLSKKHGIETGTFIMIGYPGETEADIDATIEHLKRADPDQFTITVAYPIKGTPYYEDVRDDIVDPRPWEASTDRDLKLRRPRMDFYYKLAVARVVNEVRSFQATNRAGGAPSFAAAKHTVKALVARGGMRVEPTLRALDTRARRVFARA
ncbi:MAG TPA: radical SAM protein [Polyangiaceae bacterium]|nr:radical SAM protein [Polyangiaceae bacterium]